VYDCLSVGDRPATGSTRHPKEDRTIVTESEPNFPRRKFNKLLALSGLAALAAGVLAFFRWRFSNPAYPAKIVARVGEIPVEGSKIFTYPTDLEPCILIRPAEDTYVAFSRLCTHGSCPVFYRPAQNRLDCPCHQGAFSLADGSVLGGPPPRPLPRVVLERRGVDLVATGVSKG
jgi:nitrite reductase/ring-hydroxylating ferredoxin subunit